jgi:hypothetical protein
MLIIGRDLMKRENIIFSIEKEIIILLARIESKDRVGEYILKE